MNRHVWRCVVLVMLVIGAVSVMAQGAAPTAEPLSTFALRQGGKIASMGGFLAAADGESVQMIDVRDPRNPRSMAIISLDGEPSAMAASGDFVLAGIGGDTNEMIVIAPDRYRRGRFAWVNALPIPTGVRMIAVARDGEWALVSGADSYASLHVTAADNIESSAFMETSPPIIGAALLDQEALMLVDGRASVDVLSLSINETQAAEALRLEGAATALALDDDLALGAVSLADNRLTLFDVAQLETIQTIALEDGAVRKMVFIHSGERRTLALMIEGREAVMLLDVTDPNAVSLPGSVGVDGTVLDIAAGEDYLAVSTTTGVSLFLISS